MLPDPLKSVWREYKQDTDFVASWLASTAEARGFTAGLLTPVAAPKKKKKRTQKRVPTKYIVAIKDFVPLAKFIADCKNPVVDVPASFVTTIDRVIDVRSTFSNQLIEHGVKIEKRSQSTHAHFTGILKQVREALRPRMQTATATWQESSSTFFADALPSSFEALELDEPSQDSQNAPDVKRPEPDKGVDMAIYEAEQAAYSELEDAMFAYSVMLEDLRKIRVQIVSMWENYHNGVIDLAVAAVATNTAIELARNVADEVIPLFRSHGGVWRIARLHYFAAALSGGFSLEDLGLSVEGANNGMTFNCKTYDIANATYTIAYKFLKEFQAVLQPNTLPLFKPGFFGTYDPTSKFETKSPEDKFQEDQVIMMEFFGELMAVIRSLPDWPVEDEFLRGMRDMDTTKDVPFYLVFAAQVFLDIHHILGNEVERGFQEMSTETNIMRNNLESHLEFHKDLKIDSWTRKHDAPLIFTKSVIEWLSTDPINKIIVARARNEGMSLSPESRQYSLLRQSPVMSGLILHHFRLELYDIGISVANA
ncbi:hypothetical protein K4K52_011656 [Colletotrichum sp. SAR 10_76]|nr:hypothetical protein K4K52_011656 [Colletotrichum sp. SAR 10_76]